MFFITNQVIKKAIYTRNIEALVEDAILKLQGGNADDKNCNISSKGYRAFKGDSK